MPLWVPGLPYGQISAGCPRRLGSHHRRLVPGADKKKGSQHCPENNPMPNKHYYVDVIIAEAKDFWLYLFYCIHETIYYVYDSLYII